MVGYSERYDGLDREGDKKKQKKRMSTASRSTKTGPESDVGLDRLFDVCWGRHEISFDEFGEKILGTTGTGNDMRVIEKILELENEAWEKGYGGLEYSIDESRRTICVEGITGGMRDVEEIQNIIGNMLDRVGEIGQKMPYI